MPELFADMKFQLLMKEVELIDVTCARKANDMFFGLPMHASLGAGSHLKLCGFQAGLMSLSVLLSQMQLALHGLPPRCGAKACAIPTLHTACCHIFKVCMMI